MKRRIISRGVFLLFILLLFPGIGSRSQGGMISTRGSSVSRMQAHGGADFAFNGGGGITPRPAVGGTTEVQATRP